MISVKTIVGLSHDLSNATTVYPGDPVPNIAVATTIAKHGYNLFNVSLGSQSGSHVDAPHHFSDTGRTVDKIGLKLCMGRACIVDVSFKKANVRFDNPFFIALPLKLTGCDGSPVRAVAVQFHD